MSLQQRHTATRPADPRRLAARVAQIAEYALAAAGLVCLAIYTGACAHTAYSQYQGSAEFDRALARAIAAERHDQSEWSPQRVEHFDDARATAMSNSVAPIGRLEIPTAGVSVMVLEGTDDLTLNRAVGHIEDTALPGENGNMGIAGHRDGFFRGMRHVEVGDEISLTTLEGLARYEVVKVHIVEPQDVEVLDPTTEPTLTLVTCFPFYYVGAAPQRHIVHARQVRFAHWNELSDPDDVTALERVTQTEL